MDADFDLSKLDDIPDVLTPAQRAAASAPAAPRISTAASGPPRALVARQRALALFVSLAWLGAQVAILGLRKDLGRLGAAYPLAQIALPAALSALALGAAVWPGRGGLGASAATLRAVVVVGLVLTGALAFWPSPFVFVPPENALPFASWVLVCADIVAIMGVVPLALGALALRRAVPAAAGARGAALGAASGLGAVTAMHLHCENIEPAHVLLGHMVPAIALVAAAAWLVRHVIRA